MAFPGAVADDLLAARDLVSNEWYLLCGFPFPGAGFGPVLSAASASRFGDRVNWRATAPIAGFGWPWLVFGEEMSTRHLYRHRLSPGSSRRSSRGLALPRGPAAS